MFMYKILHGSILKTVDICKNRIEMEKKLLDYFNKIMSLTQAEREAIAATILIQKYKKGTILLNEGQVSNAAYFVLEGCVRQYYMTENGEEITTNFYMPEQWVTTIQSFRNQIPSNHFLSCATDVALVVGKVVGKLWC